MIKEWISNSSVRLCFWLILLSFVGGVYAGKVWFQVDPVVCPAAVTTDVKINEKKSSNKITKIVKEIKKPDGTVIKTTTEEKETAKDISKTSEHENVTPIKPALTHYSLGLKYLPALSTPPSVKDLEIEGGARLGGSNFWGTGGYDVKHNQLSIGIRYEW